jgi:predicted  nucleic acid-binding Zn-ribbon protein
MNELQIKILKQKIANNERLFRQLDYNRVKATNDGDWNTIQEIDQKMEILKDQTEQLRGKLPDDVVSKDEEDDMM